MEYIHTVHQLQWCLSPLYLHKALRPFGKSDNVFLWGVFSSFANELCHVGVDTSSCCFFRNLSFLANHKWKHEEERIG